MAFLECHFHSDVLGHACEMNVILPQKVSTQIGMASSGSGRRSYPVLYLLHGLSDDHTIWSRRSAIERHVATYEIAVVMPNGERGFYTDMKQGPRYWTMLTEELPEIVSGLFPVSTKREDTFVAGLSMGGYGALKCALRYPDRYAAAVALSAVTDIPGRIEAAEWSGLRSELVRIFGTPAEVAGSGNDLFALASQVAKLGSEAPRLLSICGTEDFLHADNQRFRDRMKEVKYANFQYEEAPGAHQWEFWDLHIQRGLRFLLEGK